MSLVLHYIPPSAQWMLKLLGPRKERREGGGQWLFPVIKLYFFMKIAKKPNVKAVMKIKKT